MSSRRLPITAYAVSNGLGRTETDVLSALREGRHGLVPCPIEVPFETVCGVVEGPLRELDERHARYESRLTRVAVDCFRQLDGAIDRAIERFGSDRVALVVSTSTGGIHETELAYRHWYDTGELLASYDIHRQHNFAAFADVLRDVAGIEGPRYVVSTACSSSGKVFASARRLIEADVADAVVVGGVDTLCLTTMRGFHSLGVLSAEPCRPFALERPGMNIGEGAGFLVLERDGDPRAMLLGVGESGDAYHMSAPHPEGRGARLAMERALADAGVRASEVDYVNAHGTGTSANDVPEARAVEAVFGREVPVVSTKSYTGHTLGAGGATEAVFAIMALEHGFIPPSLRATPVDPNVGIRVATTREEGAYRRVISNSFAFGGSNVSVLFGAAS